MCTKIKGGKTEFRFSDFTTWHILTNSGGNFEKNIQHNCYLVCLLSFITSVDTNAKKQYRYDQQASTVAFDIDPSLWTTSEENMFCPAILATLAFICSDVNARS